MNKTELIKLTAEASNESVASTTNIINKMLDTITTELKVGGIVKITDFGIFSCTPSAARIGHNPATGEAVDIAASNRVIFKASSVLKGVCNG